MSQSLEKYLDICVQAAGNPDYDVQYALGKRHAKLAQKLAKMTDDALGDWLVSEDDTSRAAEDAVRIVGQERIEAALINMYITDVERLLLDASKTFLEETQGEVNIGMPEELQGIEDDEKLVNKLCSLYNNDTAKALLVLSSEGELLGLLRKQMLSCYEVSMILVDFYEELMED